MLRVAGGPPSTNAVDFEAPLREQMVRAPDRTAAAHPSAPLVLAALRHVPREAIPARRAAGILTYEDAPLPIEQDQTISQPYIVAMMVEALALKGGEKVLEIGTGSGYAAAVIAQIAGTVYTVERIGQLAEKSAAKLAELGYRNVRVLHGRRHPGVAGTRTLMRSSSPPAAHEVPQSLKSQLKVGGRMVIPVGAGRRDQELVRVTRLSDKKFETEDLADVRFVPLVGAEGWAPETRRVTGPGQRRPARGSAEQLSTRVARGLRALRMTSMRQIWIRCCSVSGSARVVLLGEATHGTSEFYRMRARILAREAHRAPRILIHRDRG